MITITEQVFIGETEVRQEIQFDTILELIDFYEYQKKQEVHHEQ